MAAPGSIVPMCSSGSSGLSTSTASAAFVELTTVTIERSVSRVPLPCSVTSHTMDCGCTGSTFALT
eukprot:3399547-Pleurochrysis_carterae.AAC.1